MRLAVSLTFGNDSAISAFALLPGADLHCARENSARAEASVRLRSKIFARCKSRNPDNSAFFPLPLETPVKIRSKYTENFAMRFNVDSFAYFWYFSTARIYVHIRDPGILGATIS